MIVHMCMCVYVWGATHARTPTHTLFLLEQNIRVLVDHAVNAQRVHTTALRASNASVATAATDTGTSTYEQECNAPLKFVHTAHNVSITTLKYDRIISVPIPKCARDNVTLYAHILAVPHTHSLEDVHAQITRSQLAGESTHRRKMPAKPPVLHTAVALTAHLPVSALLLSA